MSSTGTPYIEIGHGRSRHADAFCAGAEAAGSARSRLAALSPAVVMVYASVHYEFTPLLAGVASVFAGVPVIGASTAGELDGGLHQDSVVVVVLASPYLRMCWGVGRQVTQNWRAALDSALAEKSIAPYFQAEPAFWKELTRTGTNIFAWLFSPGNTAKSDSFSHELLESLKTKALGRFPIVGGSAADDWRLETNYVFSGGEAIPDGVLVALFETRLQFGIALAHGFAVQPGEVTITGVEGKEVLSLDGRPAAAVYAEIMESSVGALENRHLTLTTGRTLGIVDSLGGNQVNVATFLTPRGGVRLTQPVTVGMKLSLLEARPGTMVNAASEALRKAMVRGAITAPAVALVNYCALRQRLIGDAIREELAAAQALMGSAPLVGFSSFGEQGLTDDGSCRHSNGAVSVLVLGTELSRSAQVARENEILRDRLEQQTEALRVFNRELEERIGMRTRELAETLERLKREVADKERFQQQLLLAQKLESIGQLASGIAHEINTPAQYVGDNIHFLQDAHSALRQILAELARLHTEAKGSLPIEMDALIAGADLDYYAQEIPRAIQQALEGVERVTSIVRAMKDFAHPDGGVKDLVNLNHAIASTLLIARNEWKYLAEVKTNYDLELPPVPCFLGEFNQVILNLVINATHAIADAVAEGRIAKGVITVSTAYRGDVAEIRVEDNGTGIPADVLPRIFDPFFTTKKLGQGTGQGLAISHNVIVKKHCGSIKVETETGRGTAFILTLPVKPSAAGSGTIPHESQEC